MRNPNFINMKRLLTFLAFIQLSSLAFGQIYTKPNNGYGAISNRGSFDSALYIPTGCGVPTDSTFLFSKGFGQGQILKKAAKYYDSCGHHEYVWDPALLAWHRVDSSAGGGGSFYDSTLMASVKRLKDTAAAIRTAPGNDQDVIVNKSGKYFAYDGLTYTDAFKSLCIGCDVSVVDATLNGGGAMHGGFTVAPQNGSLTLGGDSVNLKATAGTNHAVRIITNNTVRLNIDNAGIITFPTLASNSDSSAYKPFVFNPSTHVAGYLDHWPVGSTGSGLSSLNGLTGSTQTFATGTSGSDFNIASSGTAHTFNFPDGSSSHRGLITSADWSTFNAKQPLLVSGTNLKTINGNSLLGSGDLPIAGGGGPAITTPFLGYIFKANTFADLSSFTQAGSTFAASSGKIVVTNGTAGYGNILSYNYYSLLENWSFPVRFKINSTSGSSGGLALGIYSTASTAVHALGEFILSGANSGKVTLNLQDNTQYAISSGALSWSNGDSIILVVSRNRDIISVRATDITTAVAPVEATYTYTVAGTPSMPTMGRFSIFNLGGTQSLTIDSVAIFSKELKGTDVYGLGNSKFQYSVVSQFQNALIPRLGESYSVINGGGIGAQTADMLLLLPEIYALRPKVVLLGDVTRNDQGASVSSTTYRANLIGLYDSLHAHSIGVGIMRPFYEHVLDQSAQDAWECANFPVDSLIDSYTPIKNNAATAVYSDNIHLTDFGDSLLYGPTIAYLTKVGLSATKTPAVLGEGKPNSIALWKDSRHLYANGPLFNGNNLDIPGYAAFGKFVSYNQESIWAGPFPGGGTALHLTDPIAGTDQKTMRLWWHGGTFQGDIFKDDFSGAMNLFSISGTGTTAPILTFLGKTYINRSTDDGSADATGLMVLNGISISSGSSKDGFFGVIGNYDHYFGYGRLSSGNPYWYENNLNAGTNQKLWDGNYDATGIFTLRALTDGAGGATSIYSIDRSAYPTINFNFLVPIGVGTSTPNASALLDLTSTTRGLLIPRMITTQRNAISSPATGLEIFNTTTGQFEFYNGSAWVAVGGSSAPFSDATALVSNSSDATKLVKLSAASISAITTRTWTFPDVSGTFARIDAAQTFTGVQTFSSSPIIPTASPGDNSTKGASTAYVDAAAAKAAHDSITALKMGLDSIFIRTIETTNATPVNVDTIPFFTTAEVVTITVKTNAQNEAGGGSYIAFKTFSFQLDASTTTTFTPDVSYEHYKSGGNLSTCSITASSDGVNIYLTWTGEASKTIHSTTKVIDITRDTYAP